MDIESKSKIPLMFLFSFPVPPKSFHSFSSPTTGDPMRLLQWRTQLTLASACHRGETQISIRLHFQVEARPFFAPLCTTEMPQWHMARLQWEVRVWDAASCHLQDNCGNSIYSHQTSLRSGKRSSVQLYGCSKTISRYFSKDMLLDKQQNKSIGPPSSLHTHPPTNFVSSV